MVTLLTVHGPSHELRSATRPSWLWRQLRIAGGAFARMDFIPDATAVSAVAAGTNTNARSLYCPSPLTSPFTIGEKGCPERTTAASCIVRLFERLLLTRRLNWCRMSCDERPHWKSSGLAPVFPPKPRTRSRMLCSVQPMFQEMGQLLKQMPKLVGDRVTVSCSDRDSPSPWFDITCAKSLEMREETSDTVPVDGTIVDGSA